jgi:hypothetical protein
VNIHEFNKPFPVSTPLGYGWVIYVVVQSHLANDLWCVAMEDGGRICHFRSDQVRALTNETLGIVGNDFEPEAAVRRKSTKS